jgi:large subunit ribosomal protein L3
MENEKTANQPGVQLDGLYLFKEGMSTWFDSDSGQAIPVTVMRYEPHVVSQIKDKAKDGYNAAQVTIGQKTLKSADKAALGHLKASGLQKPGLATKEIPILAPDEAIQVGVKVLIDSLKAGDVVKVIGQSKGKGFAGSVKRFGFAGGPMSHGSKFHRQPGSSGNRTWPGRVMPGKKFPGHLGAKTIHVKNLKVVKVDSENNVVLIKGSVPGGRNTLVGVFRS